MRENGFQDSLESMDFLERPEGKKAIVHLNVAGILDYLYV